MKTVIKEMQQTISDICQTAASFRHNPLMLEAEEHVYELLISEEKTKLKLELEKAKKMKP